MTNITYPRGVIIENYTVTNLHFQICISVPLNFLQKLWKIFSKKLAFYGR